MCVYLYDLAFCSIRCPLLLITIVFSLNVFQIMFNKVIFFKKNKPQLVLYGHYVIASDRTFCSPAAQVPKGRVFFRVPG